MIVFYKCFTFTWISLTNAIPGNSMTFSKASVSYSRSRIPHIFTVEFWTLWSPDRIFRRRSSKLVCRVSILIMLFWFSNCLSLGRPFVSLTLVLERGGILTKTNSSRIYKPVLCVRHLSCFRSYLSMSFKNCTIQPWWHSWIATLPRRTTRRRHQPWQRHGSTSECAAAKRKVRMYWKTVPSYE